MVVDKFLFIGMNRLIGWLFFLKISEKINHLHYS